jgi:hypothetical protein
LVTVVAGQGTLTPFDRFGANLTRKLWCIWTWIEFDLSAKHKKEVYHLSSM